MVSFTDQRLIYFPVVPFFKLQRMLTQGIFLFLQFRMYSTLLIFSFPQVIMCCRIASSKVKEITAKIKKSLEKDNEKR